MGTAERNAAFECVLARKVGRLFSKNRSDTRKNVSETFVCIAHALAIPKVRFSALRNELTDHTRMDRSIHDHALAAVQVCEVEEFTS